MVMGGEGKGTVVDHGAHHAGMDNVYGAALIAGLNAYVHRMADMLPVVHANCRRFHDPAAGRLRGHSGRHPDNVARFVDNALFPGKGMDSGKSWSRIG